MKKFLKIVLILVGAAFLISVLPDADGYYQNFKLRFQKLPEKYEKVAILDQLKDDIYEVEAFDNAYHEPLFANDSTVVISKSQSLYEDNETATDVWYKINTRGKAVDSLKYVHNKYKTSYFNINRLIVDFENKTYNTWIKDGDSTAHAIPNLAGNRIVSDAEFLQMIKGRRILSKNYTTLYGKSEEADSQIVYILDGEKPGYFYVRRDLSIDNDDFQTNTFEVPHSDPVDGLRYEEDAEATTTENKEVPAKISYYKPADSKSPIYREYTHKDSWEYMSFWNFSLAFNGTTADHWLATSYYELKMPKKTLHYKYGVKVFEMPNGEFVDDDSLCKIYKAPGGKFCILYNTENEVGKAYIVREKSTF